MHPESVPDKVAAPVPGSGELAADILLAATEAAGLVSPDELDRLSAELCAGRGFQDLMLRTFRDYRPTMRVDLDPRYARLAAAFDLAAERLGQARRAWTPAYSDAQRALLRAWRLTPA